VAGPLRFGDQVIAWSSRRIYCVNAQALREISFPPGFEAWTERHGDAGLRFPLGRPPALVCGNSLYLAGFQAQRPVLLHAQQRHTSWPMAAIPIPAHATCGLDGEGRPLLAMEGKLCYCEGGALREIRTDTQIASSRVALACGELHMAFCDVHGNERLRVFRGQISHEIPLGLQNRPLEVSGFWLLGSAVAVGVLTQEQKTEVFSWHV
jgi:hypothetical protein